MPAFDRRRENLGARIKIIRRHAAETAQLSPRRLRRDADPSHSRTGQFVGDDPPLTRSTRGSLSHDQVEEISDFAVSLDGVPQRFVRQNAILVLATNPLAFDETAFFQVLHDPLDRPLRDADLSGDLT